MSDQPDIHGTTTERGQEDNPRSILLHILRTASDPHDREAIRERFYDAMTADCETDPPRVLQILIDDWFDNHYKHWLQSQPKSARSREELRAEREKRHAARQQREKEVAMHMAEIEAAIDRKADEKAILLLATMMPNGKAFGD